MTPPRVAVAYLHPGQVSASFSMSLLELVLYEAHRTGLPPLIVANRCSSGRLVEGRNEVARDFLDRTDCDWLLFVDADMGFGPDALERLLKSADKYTRPIVGGLCFGLRRDGTDRSVHADIFRCFPTIYEWAETDDKAGFRIVADYPRDQVVRSAATGAAFVLIHRRALDAIRARDGDHWFSQVTHPKGPTTFSEDMSFCLRAAAAGQAVHVDTRVKTSHDKGGVVLTEHTWDAQQALTSLAQAVEAEADAQHAAA